VIRVKKIIKANAKINIGLNIVDKLPNGYHLLDMTMIPISLSDILTIDIEDENGILEISSNDKDMPLDESNIVYKIYNMFYERTGLEKRKIHMYIDKNIPSQAGLGGGSSDGAAFLNFLNEFHEFPLSEEQCIEYSKSIGADIPFFIVNRPARVRGIGEKLDIINNKISKELILIKPKFGVSTVEAYGNFSKIVDKKDSKIDEIIKGLEIDELELIESNIENHLEQGLLLTNKDIIEFRNKLDLLKDKKFYMSGSGSCYYTLVDKTEAIQLYEKLKVKFEDSMIYLCSFL